ncbi:serine/threonine-protein kinase [Rhodotorula paludigena]|uniref:serine/threonine-protein kinase n=1 Tax=Rhodotorula paludigena TaxID=86838 RepID=UPI00316BB663
MEQAALGALELSQQSQQFTQTQPQTQQPSQPFGDASTSASRFPAHLWGVLVSVARGSEHTLAAAAAEPPARGQPRPDRLELARSKAQYTVGRHPKCDIVLQGPKISSYHAKIRFDAETGVVRLEDTSTNGTFVRNRKVGKGNVTIVESGDNIVFGPPSNLDDEFSYLLQLDTSAPSSSHGIDPYGLGDLSQSQSTHGDGRSIHTAYEVREQIGKGSFATVRKGVRRSDGRMVAVKIIQRARFASNPKTMEMIEREVEIMKGLEHRFCVKCIDYFEDDQRIWLVLEYVDGGDLLDYVMKRRGLKESETREIALMVCEAVAYLHSKGITHRDLKPENLLLTRGQKPVCKVTDFGLAKMVDDQTMLKTMCGTPTYLAPEVILNPSPSAGYGSLVDAWSIGVVLYSCLTNQTPFDESESTPLPQRMRERRIDLSVPRSLGVSEVACDFLSKLLVADPRGRMSCQQALNHPWLRLKSSANGDSASPTLAHPFTDSTLPYNDPLRADGDVDMTTTSPAMSRANADGGASAAGGVEEEDSGIDSQGFGKLRINGNSAISTLSPPLPASRAPPSRPPVPPFNSGTKRKEPMSAFSDSSLSGHGSVPASAMLVDRSPARKAETTDEDQREPSTTEESEDVFGSRPAAPAPVVAQQDFASLRPEPEPLEPAAPAEAEEVAADTTAGKTDERMNEDVEDEVVAEQADSRTEESTAPPATSRRSTRQPRSSIVKKVASTPGRSGRARGRASTAAAAARQDDDEEEETEGSSSPAATRKKEGPQPEVGGIAAGVKSRRRKAARHY